MRGSAGWSAIVTHLFALQNKGLRCLVTAPRFPVLPEIALSLLSFPPQQQGYTDPDQHERPDPTGPVEDQ
ncbi:MAG: hypothetical protein ACK44M_13575, partial [Chloroflexus sp.]